MIHPGLGDLFSPPFYHFYEPGNPASVLEGLSHIRSRVEEKGPFEGVFAFSEGAAAFLSTLVHGEMDFKFMVLVSPVLPFDISGQKRLDATMTNGPIFNIPAIVIRGRNDVIGLMAIMAKELLVEETTVSLEWPGGHEVPSACERSLWSSVVERILELCP